MTASSPHYGMNEQRARELLKPRKHNSNWHFDTAIHAIAIWLPKDGYIHVSGHFTVDQLEAIAWWMRNMAPAPNTTPQP